jgi:hypothetical protein
MKKIYSIVAGLLLTASVFAQAPEKMSYQAVIRNSSNTLITSAPVGMKISVLQGTSTGIAVYVETQTPSTNANGLLSLEIGTGTIVTGTFVGINWSAGPYFFKTETDPTGGTNYTITNTNQLLSVPYAMYSANSGSSTPGPQGPAGLLPNGNSSGNTPYWNGTNWVVNSSNIYNNGGNIGIGTSNPSENLVVSKSVGATAGTNNFLLVETIISPLVNSSQGVIINKDDGQKRGFKLYQNGSDDSNSTFKIASFSASSDIDRFTIKRNNGNVGIGTTTPTSKLHVVGLPVFADNASAITGGLTAGAFYRTSVGVLMVTF